MTIAPGLTGSLDRPTDYARLEFTKRQAASAVATCRFLDDSETSADQNNRLSATIALADAVTTLRARNGFILTINKVAIKLRDA
jgi:hypothetical protein